MPVSNPIYQLSAPERAGIYANPGGLAIDGASGLSYHLSKIKDPHYVRLHLKRGLEFCNQVLESWNPPARIEDMAHIEDIRVYLGSKFESHALTEFSQHIKNLRCDLILILDGSRLISEKDLATHEGFLTSTGMMMLGKASDYWNELNRSHHAV